MKKITLILTALSLVLLLNAQTTIKLGHINTQALLESMPESDSAKVKFENIRKELELELENMQVEFNKKQQDLLSKEKTMSEAIKQAKQSELQDIYQRLQQFQTTAQEDMQRQRGEIYKPVIDKATKAINAVGKENGFTYIFDTSAGVLVFQSENSTDITTLVKAKLKSK